MKKPQHHQCQGQSPHTKQKGNCAMTIRESSNDNRWATFKAYADAYQQALKERTINPQELDEYIEVILLEMPGDAVLHDNALLTLETFYRAGVPLSEARYFMRLAVDKASTETDAAWRYFCGCCHNFINDTKARAYEIMGDSFES